MFYHHIIWLQEATGTGHRCPFYGSPYEVGSCREASLFGSILCGVCEKAAFLDSYGLA